MQSLSLRIYTGKRSHIVELELGSAIQTSLCTVLGAKPQLGELALFCIQVGNMSELTTGSQAYCATYAQQIYLLLYFPQTAGPVKTHATFVREQIWVLERRPGYWSIINLWPWEAQEYWTAKSYQGEKCGADSTIKEQIEYNMISKVWITSRSLIPVSLACTAIPRSRGVRKMLRNESCCLSDIGRILLNI